MRLWFLFLLFIVALLALAFPIRDPWNSLPWDGSYYGPNPTEVP